MNRQERFALGIDVGSASVKVSLMRDGKGGYELVSGRSERIRRRGPEAVAGTMFEQMLSENGLGRQDLDYIATTGEGEAVAFRTGHFYGMTTHARGARFLEPEADACIDIGALHARAIVMDERAKVLGYRMTSQCASGSGQFLENISRYLGVTMAEIGSLSLGADAPEQCSSICAVLAETDVINMVSRGISTPNILKGIHLSMAGRYVKLLNSAGAKKVALVTGGLAADVGLMAAIRETLEQGGSALEIRAHEHSALAGAIGAGIWGAFRSRKMERLGVSLDAGLRA
ncbi:MAG TPA: benzoyl-CoA reductase subunit D [Planctomycetota bacterium]|jgi:benzoyl-CoA reductase subunit D|nr:benzoyl-CoA reductase subunit D [Planctomycetota bacterium]